ncbi:MAG: serpin family protein [Actinobacteria bacterium]|nr:serpin family protein [Actinomycetota bacterium]
MNIRKIILLISIVLVIFIVAFSAAGCCAGISYLFRKTPKETKANKQSDKNAAVVDKALVDSDTDFALKIFKELSDEDIDINSNVFISPISISIAAAMVYNGAKNQTQEEIAQALEFTDFTPEKLNESFKTLLSSMTDIDEMVELYVGNSIWYRKDFNVEKSFMDLTKDYYDASVYDVDFTSQDTAGRINNWVSEATKNKISKIVDQNALKDAVMYLINAIYFKGQWKDKFKEENTKEDTFYLPDNSTKKIQMMQNNEKYMYYKGADFRMLRMPYGRDKTAMYILLPDENVGLDMFINGLSGDLLDKCITEASSAEVDLKFPKFKVEYGTKSLIEPFKKLGMINSFTGKADFSGIAPQMFISQIDHKAVIEVNEEGTVAAAATSIGMGATAIMPVEFIVNRPFALMIRDDRTGNILFIGKIMEP